jgi:hypothetical protein
VTSAGAIAAVLPPALRGNVVNGSKCNSICLAIGACLFLAPISTAAAAGNAEERWRVFDRDNEASLAITTTEGDTDDYGSPYFQCRRGSGRVQVGGDAKRDLLTAMADVIRVDEYPRVHVFPVDSGDTSLLNLSYSEMRGWQYSFDLEAAGAAFDEFKRTGRLTYKVGTTVVTEEFKTGLESAATFQDICKQQPRVMRERSN